MTHEHHELQARVEQLEQALGDEGRLLDETARNAEDLVSELERVARAGETPIETLRRVLAEPTEKELVGDAIEAIKNSMNSCDKAAEYELVRILGRAVRGEPVDPKWETHVLCFTFYMLGAQRKARR